MQLSFGFKNDSAEFLLTEENQEAHEFFQKFFAQKNLARSAILIGESKSGKTSLLNSFKADLHFLTQPTAHLVADEFYVLENIDQYKNENAILHLINTATEASASLILTTNIEPNFKLPDLASRVKNIFSLRIKKPSESTMKMLLTLHLAKRQLKLKDNLIDFILHNLERSYTKLFDIVHFIEFFAIENKRMITTAELSKIINERIR